MQHEPLIGRTLGHYTILLEIGRGGMGSVYRARDTRLERDVAVKVLPPDLAGDAERLHRFKTEARSLARLNHRNIVTIHDVDDQEGIAFLVMELVAGLTLRELMPRGGFDLQRFFSLAIPLAEAVGAAHDREIAHLDLKPGNVMVTPEGRVKVLDFGLAKLRSDDEGPLGSAAPTETITLAARGAGTIAYMSPEQVRGESIDHRSDIFSLGIVLYEMATGRHPFRGESGAESASSILRDQPPEITGIRAELPRHLARMIRQCLEKSPERRLQSAKDLANGLKDLREELASEADAARASAPRARSRRPLLQAAGLALALVLAALLAWSRRGVEPPPVPRHLAVAGFRGFPGERGTDPFREGILAALRWRLRDLRGVYVLPENGHPEADFRLEADVHRSAETVSVSYRLLRADGGDSLGGDILRAPPAEVFPLLDRVIEDVGDRLRSGAALKTRFVPRAAPTSSTGALDLYLSGSALRDSPADLERGIELLGASIAQDPGFALAHAALGEANRVVFVLTRDAASLEAAHASCAESAALDPALAEAEICLGRVSTALGRSVEAAAHFEKAIELDATAHQAYDGLLAAHLALLGNPAVAEKSWRRIIERYPGYWAGYFYLGKYWSAQAHYALASDLYRQALALAPRNATAYTSLGGALIWEGDYEEAIVALERAIAIRPGEGAYSNLGYVLFLVRRFDEAIAALERSVQFPGAEHMFFGNLGKAYYWGGRRRQARATFERAVELSLRRLEIEPANADARTQLPWYEAMLGEEESALAHLGELLVSNPEDPHVLFTAGQIHNQLGDPDRALEFLERAVAVGGGYSTAEIRQSIEFDNLRSEPRFQALLSHAERH